MPMLCIIGAVLAMHNSEGSAAAYRHFEVLQRSWIGRIVHECESLAGKARGYSIEKAMPTFPQNAQHERKIQNGEQYVDR